MERPVVLERSWAFMVLDGFDGLPVKHQAEPTPETPKESPGNGLGARKEGRKEGREGWTVWKECYKTMCLYG